MLAAIPEHPSARQARAKAWQQIAAIGPSGAAQWPQRGARTAQAAALMGLAPSPKARRPSPPRRPTRPRRRAEPQRRPRPGGAEAEGIVWLNAGGTGPAASPVVRGARPATRLPARPLARAEAAGPKGRFLLWVDAVGGYLVCLDDRIILGRAGPDSPADVPLMGDLSRNHATLIRERRQLRAPGPSRRRSSTASRWPTRPCSATAT